MARPTVQGCFEGLTDTLLGTWLPAWRPRARVKEVQHPKFYWFDCGVLRVLTRRLHEPLDSAERGHLLEALVLGELRAHMAYAKCHAVCLGDTPQQDGPVNVRPLHAFLEELSAGRMFPSSPLARRSAHRTSGNGH
ncbi:MAG: hypothetical protein FJ191_00805 [Gammaproteobacteria bacterium]|nr:hypothetical protein [Gammaproteobacteria bacterium]